MQESSTEVETAAVSPGSAYDLEAAPKLDHRQEKVHQIALAYAAAFPHAGVKALEAHIAMVGLGGEIAAGMDEAIARAGFELTRSRVMLLRLLYFAEGRQLYLNEVAREMAVSAAAVSQLVDSLARDGWVERVVSPLDRRFTFAKLTASGEERCSRLVPLVADYMAHSVAAALTDEELDQLLALLAKLMNHMDVLKG